MTDLNAKFVDLESQLATQHTVIESKLDALLAALQATGTAECTNYYPTSTAFTLTGNYNGYSFIYPHSVQLKIDSGIYANMPANTTYTFSVDTTSIAFRDINDYDETLILCAPPPSGATLTSIAGILATISTTLAAMQLSNTAYQTASLSVLDSLYLNIETMLQNNSLNTQRLLIAIAANDPCRDCAVIPIAPPPTQITPQTVDTEHCQRMQALIYALKRFTVKLDLLSSFGLGFSPTVIRDAIAEIITELGLTGQLEYPSLGEVAQLAGAAAAYVVSNIFSDTSLPAEFLAIEDSLLPVLYDTDNASAGQAAYRSLLDASELDTTVVMLFKAMAYTSVFNLYYDRTIEVDLSGYDGSICEPVLWDRVFTEIYSATNPAFDSGDISGWENYHLVSEATAGSILIHVWIDGVDTHTWSGNHEEYFDTTGVVRVVLSFPGFASGTVYLEGAPSFGA